jgi:ketosteroid isomerase-like protein
MARTRSLSVVTALALTGVMTAAGDASTPQESTAIFNRPVDVQEVTRLESDVQLLSNVDDLMRIVHRNVTAFGGRGDWSEGWEAIYDHEARSYAAVPEADRPSHFDGLWWIKDYNIATDGELACVAMHVSIPMKDKSGRMTAYAFPELDVWRKFGSNWLAVQLHTYAPMDPATSKSITDFQPPRREPVKWSNDPLPGPAGDPRKAETELRAWLAARTTSTDPDALVRLFGPGDDTVAYTPYIPVEHRGLAEIRRSLTQGLRDVRTISAEVLNFNAHSDGMMSTIIARQKVTMTMKDGTTRTVTSRHSNCLRRVGNDWRSMFEMVSYPNNVPSRLEELRDKQAPERAARR